MSLADYHKESGVLVKVAHEAGADFVIMERVECKRKIVYQITATGHLTDRQKGVICNKIGERYIVIMFVMNSNQNKYDWYKEDCNNNCKSQNKHRWP